MPVGLNAAEGRPLGDAAWLLGEKRAWSVIVKVPRPAVPVVDDPAIEQFVGRLPAVRTLVQVLALVFLVYTLYAKMGTLPSMEYAFGKWIPGYRQPKLLESEIGLVKQTFKADATFAKLDEKHCLEIAPRVG